MTIGDSPYYGSNVGPDIKRGLSAIASMFAPPSASDLAAYASARDNNADASLKQQKQSIIDKLRADPRYVGADAGVLAGLFNPTQSWAAQDQNDATARRAQDVTASTSITNNTADNQTKLLTTRFGPVAQDAMLPEMPLSIGSMFGINEDLPQVNGLRSPLSETQWQAGQDQRLLDSGQLTDQNLVDTVMGKNAPVKAVGAAGQPVYMNPGEAVRTGAEVAPTPPSTIINNGGENAYDKTEGEANAKTDIQIQADAATAQGTINTVEAMRSLMADPNFYSGPAANQIQAAKQIGATLGITVPDAASPMEAFNALSNQLVIDAAGGSLGNQISNGDVHFLQASKPNLGNTQPGNALMLDITSKLAHRKMEVAQWAAEYKASHGGRLDGGWIAFEKAKAEANPLFPPLTEDHSTPGPQAGAVAPEGTVVSDGKGGQLIKRGGRWVPVS